MKTPSLEPENDDEYQKGEEVIVRAIIVSIGNSKTDYDYIIRINEQNVYIRLEDIVEQE